jgi:hypothetical protein
MPKSLRPLADKAIARHMKRPLPPKINVEGEVGCEYTFSSPYAKEDGEAWEALLFQAFGTRRITVAQYFIGALVGLVKGVWDAEGHKWRPSQDEFDAIVAMVNSMQPRNEAQAAYAAQLCALHLSAMRLAKHTTTHHADPRTVRALTKTVRAYGDGLVTLQRLQGRSRTVKQSIKSESHKHVHQHIHYHGGGAENGSQPHGASEGTGHNQSAGTRLIEARATVPGEKPRGEVVRLPCREGQEGLPVARGSKG